MATLPGDARFFKLNVESDSFIKFCDFNCFLPVFYLIAPLFSLEHVLCKTSVFLPVFNYPTLSLSFEL